jgi:trimeric autotransporter adhesin
MKTSAFVRFAMATALCSMFQLQIFAAGTGTAFTYQCRLLSGTNAANGAYDLKFSLFDSLVGGVQIGNSQTNNIIFTNGLATTTLDFGAAAFVGNSRWLEIGVRTNGSGAFSNLLPRQPLTPTPYAISASNVSGTVSAAQLTGTLPGGVLSGIYTSTIIVTNPGNIFGGDGSALTFGGFGFCGLPCYWKVNGNSGTFAGANFVGTTDNQPLELKVFGQRALRLEPTASSPNVIGGYVSNYVGSNIVGGTIGGGGDNGEINFLDAAKDPLQTFTLFPHYGTISGGAANRIRAGSYSTIGGGATNSIQNNFFIKPSYSIDINTIGGGLRNGIADSTEGTVSGGMGNTIVGDIDGNFHSTISGGEMNSINATGDTIWGSTIGGGATNLVHRASYATIAGGNANRIDTMSNDSSIGGGFRNAIEPFASASAIAGGSGNTVDLFCNSAVISGGAFNLISGSSTRAAIGGGYLNTNSGSYSFIGGGSNNTVNAGADQAVLAGGAMNSVGGLLATIPGGWSNVANGAAGFAAGYRAKSLHNGAFVWADKTEADFPSTNINSFSARCVGGARFVSAVNASGTPTAGVVLTPGNGSWTSLSDRNAKDNFEPVRTEEVLDRLASVPISTWNYKAQDKSIRHIGPMAQDFAAAFQVGDDDKGITTVDADGVALAAIQGLNNKLEVEVAMKDKEIQELKHDIAELRALVTAVAQGRSLGH